MFSFSANFLLSKKKSIKARKRFQILHGKQRNKIQKYKTKRNETKKNVFTAFLPRIFLYSVFPFVFVIQMFPRCILLFSFVFQLVINSTLIKKKKKRQNALNFSSSFFPCSISHFLCFLPSTL